MHHNIQNSDHELVINWTSLNFKVQTMTSDCVTLSLQYFLKRITKSITVNTYYVQKSAPDVGILCMTMFLHEGFQNLFPCSFHFLGSRLHPLALAPFFHLQSQQQQPIKRPSTPQVTPFIPCFWLSSTFKDSCDYCSYLGSQE